MFPMGSPRTPKRERSSLNHTIKFKNYTMTCTACPTRPDDPQGFPPAYHSVFFQGRTVLCRPYSVDGWFQFMDICTLCKNSRSSYYGFDPGDPKVDILLCLKCQTGRLETLAPYLPLKATRIESVPQVSIHLVSVKINEAGSVFFPSFIYFFSCPKMKTKTFYWHDLIEALRYLGADPDEIESMTPNPKQILNGEYIIEDGSTVVFLNEEMLRERRRHCV